MLSGQFIHTYSHILRSWPKTANGAQTLHFQIKFYINLTIEQQLKFETLIYNAIVLPRNI